MNSRRIARRFIDWFAMEVPKGAHLHYAPQTDFVEFYDHPQTGFRYRAVDYVERLAKDRLSTADAYAVVEAAKQLLRPDTDDARNLLVRRALKASERRFTGEPITGFGAFNDDENLGDA